MKNEILNALNDIDPTFIDEHLKRNARRRSGRATAVRILSAAACLVIIVTAAAAFIPGGFLRKSPAAEPTEQGDFSHRGGDVTQTVVYAETLDTESINKAAELGRVELSDDLYGLLDGDEGNRLYAVDISFRDENENPDGAALSARSVAFIDELAVSFKEITVIWTDAPDGTPDTEIKLFHLTAAQLRALAAPPDLGLRVTLLPEWIDTDGETVYHKYGQ